MPWFPLPPAKKVTFGTLLEFAATFVVFAIWARWGDVPGVRALGVLTIVSGLIHGRDGRVEYGWQGREPSGYIEGPVAYLIIALFYVIGFTLVLFPAFVLSLWSSGKA